MFLNTTRNNSVFGSLFRCKIDFYFFASLLVASFHPYLSLVVGAFYAVFLFNKSLNYFSRFLLFLSPLLLVVVLGMIKGAFSELSWDWVRDVVYFFMFFSMLACGFSLAIFGYDFLSLVRVSIFFITISFFWDASSLIGAFGSSYDSVGQLRDELGQTSTLVSILVLPFLNYMPKFLKWILYCSIIPNFLTFARANIITLGFIASDFSRRVKALSFVFLFFLVPFVVYLVSSSSLINDYFDKIAFTVSEAGDTYFYDEEDIHHKWRAYERYLVSSTMDASVFSDKILGYGFGATVRSGIYKRLDRFSNDYITDIPIFHDSSLFVFLKTGYFGYFVWFAWWFSVFYIIYRSVFVFSGGWTYRNVSFFFAIVVFVVLSGFSYGYPLMRGVGLETIIVGYLVGVFKIKRSFIPLD